MRLGLFALGGVCLFFIGRELFPSRMKPNQLFSDAFDAIRNNEEV